MNNPNEVSERLRTTDENGNRIYVYPSVVRGFYKNLRNKIHGFLILFFLILPWVHWDEKQLLLLNISTREFHIFGLYFRAHDAPLIIFFLLGFLFLIGFITSIWGRLWCGWACPQTVFTESLFRRVERWIEGGPRESKELDAAPLTFKKIQLRFLKWSVFIILSLLITHSFLAYFVGSRELLYIITHSPTQNWTSFLVILFTTSIILFDFGWFREQFCIIACPYGRLQSVMLDANSMVVGYDKLRGEPRKTKLSTEKTVGDCIDCTRCVQVCPTGIDIRQGLQMECIACTACIDACDEVMAKIKKPLGLIRYTTLNELARNSKSGSRARSIIYAVLLLVFTSSLIFTLKNKEDLDITILRAKGLPYEMIHSGPTISITNHFKLDLSNQTGNDLELFFSFPSDEQIQLIMPQNHTVLKKKELKKVDFFVRFTPSILQNGSKKVHLNMRYNKKEQLQKEITLVGPNL